MSKETAVETAAEAALNVDPVNATATYTWSIKLYEYLGTCHISWSTTAPFRAQQGKVALYAGSFPSDPTQQTQAIAWDTDPSPFNTGKPWGAGWCAAYMAQKSPNGPYVYLAQTPVTKDK